jgi:hypothetical protein
MALQPAIRVNGTSDLLWLAQELATTFAEVQFYDYTKHPKPWAVSSAVSSAFPTKGWVGFPRVVRLKRLHAGR